MWGGVGLRQGRQRLLAAPGRLTLDGRVQAKNHRRRIINRNSLSEFAYILQRGGLLYVVTDVKELHEWQVAHLDAHPVCRPPSVHRVARPCA